MSYGEVGLVVGRARGESLVIGDGEDAVIVTIIAPGVNGGKVQLGIDAPAEVQIDRGAEVFESDEAFCRSVRQAAGGTGGSVGNPAYFASMLVGCFSTNPDSERIAQREVLAAIRRIVALKAQRGLA
jgi:sRNA-binding carbon storage regulator CsrA